MRVTIITDASYCPDLRVAGYGYWLASQRGREGGGGRMMTTPIDSNVVAEMMSIANALHRGLNSGLVLPGDEVLFQNDCVAALDAFKHSRVGLKGQEIAVVKYVSELVDRFDLLALYRHVKGHSLKNEPRYVANKMCDKRAKDFMRAARTIARCEQLKEMINVPN